RRLPAHRSTRRARQGEGRHVRGGAQRAPGQPLSGRARPKSDGEISSGVKIPSVTPDIETGRLHFHMEAVHSVLPDGMDIQRPDNTLLGVTLDLGKSHPGRDVILVSKDINLRIKAHALGIQAEDYTTDQVLDDANLLYTGVERLNGDFWDKHSRDMESWKEEGRTFYRISGPRVRN